MGDEHSTSQDYTAADAVPAISCGLGTVIIRHLMDDDGTANHVARAEAVRVDCHIRITLVRQKNGQIPCMEWMRLPRWVKMAACTGKILFTAPLLMDMEAKERAGILHRQIHHLRFHQCSMRPRIKADKTTKARCICITVNRGPRIWACAQHFGHALPLYHHIDWNHPSPFDRPFQAYSMFGEEIWFKIVKPAAANKLRWALNGQNQTLGITIPYFSRLASCSACVFA